MTQPAKREQIVYTALDLFYQDGFHATGIEKIRSEANVSKKTLYNHFRSKEELILAVLRKRDELFMANLKRHVEVANVTPREKLERVFDALDKWFKEKNFNGCMFINASAEFSDPDNPCNKLCNAHKQEMHNYIKEIAAEAGATHPGILSKRLNLLIEGAIVHAHTCGDKRAAQKAKDMATPFIKEALQEV